MHQQSKKRTSVRFLVPFEKKKQKNAACSCVNQKNVVPLHPQRLKTRGTLQAAVNIYRRNQQRKKAVK